MTKSESNIPEQKQAFEQDAKKQENIIDNERNMTTYNLNGIFRLKWWGIGLSILGLGAFSLYGTRKKWLPFLLITRFKRKQSSFVEAYRALIKQLYRVGLQRKEGQTLRDYAAYIDSLYGTNKMTELTSFYEKVIYRGDLEGDAWYEYRSSWEYLMKKTSS